MIQILFRVTLAALWAAGLLAVSAAEQSKAIAGPAPDAAMPLTEAPGPFLYAAEGSKSIR